MIECQYRKTKAGEWVVYGPISVVMAGATVQVKKKNGEVKDETILSVGRPFDVEGVAMVYGHTGHGWAKSGPYVPRDKARKAREPMPAHPSSTNATPASVTATLDSLALDVTGLAECHLCLAMVPEIELGQSWCDGEAVGCGEHGRGDVCLACEECRGEVEERV